MGEIPTGTYRSATVGFTTPSVPVVESMLATVMFTLCPVMPPVAPEVARRRVALFVKRVPVVWLCLPDDQFPTDLVIQVNVLRQSVYGHPGPAIPIVVTARMEVIINSDMRVVVVIETIFTGIIVTAGMLTGRGADDEQHGGNQKVDLTAHFNPPAPFWGTCVAWQQGRRNT